MNRLATILLATICIFGLTACGDTTVKRETEVKKETKIDDEGHEKTKIETKTVETRERNTDGTVENKSDPIIKLGPVEVRKK